MGRPEKNHEEPAMNRTVSRPLLVAALPVIVAACSFLPAPPATADQVITVPNHGPNVLATWHSIAAATITGTNPAGVPAATAEETAPAYDLDMATLNLAIYDTLAIVTNRYLPFRSTAAAPAGAARYSAPCIHPAAPATSPPALRRW
jgi:hypothetical protein